MSKIHENILTLYRSITGNKKATYKSIKKEYIESAEEMFGEFDLDRQLTEYEMEHFDEFMRIK